MPSLGIVKDIVQNALMGIPIVRTQAMRFHSTGMNDDPASLEAGWSFYAERTSVAGKRILELGPGRSLQLLARARREGAARCAALDVDIYEDALAVAAREGIDFRRYDGARFPLDDESFDVVWSSDVMEHVAAPAAVLAECARVLAPGGVAIFRIDLRDHAFLHDARRWLDCLQYSPGTWQLMASNRSSFVNRLRVSAWERLFAEVGLTVEELGTHDVDDATLAHYTAQPWLSGYDARDLRVYRVDAVLRRGP